MNLDPTAEIECPHCAEFFTIFLDLSQGSTEYIEDCQVCCKPIMIKVFIEDLEDEKFTVTAEPG